MIKNLFILLVLSYLSYSITIYCIGTNHKKQETITPLAAEGFHIWQQKNCQSCHQLYGLGGYMGPDITNIISDPTKGEPFARAFITNGSPKMPNFKLEQKEIDALIAFLIWVDKSGHSRINKEEISPLGSYQIKD